MERLQKIAIDEAISVFSRLLLFVEDELEPISEKVLERDLDEVYNWLVRIETCARRWKAERKEN